MTQRFKKIDATIMGRKAGAIGAFYPIPLRLSVDREAQPAEVRATIIDHAAAQGYEVHHVETIEDAAA